jgi:cytochrome c oxidase assembly protein subunit 11
MSPRTPRPAPSRRDKIVAYSTTITAAVMLGAAFAAVPLYKMFCQVTGYGGTTQVAEQAPAHRGQRTLGVRFDANVAPGLNWTFEPEVPQVQLRTGETSTVFFKVTNRSAVPVTAQASYNVSPDQAGSFFDKINCFCFNEQTLGPGETAEMPVVFFLDPALEKDETMSRVDAVTLSYTFFAVKSRPVASAAERPKL